MEVELDSGVAEQLVRVGYAAPLPAGSAQNPSVARSEHPESCVYPVPGK